VLDPAFHIVTVTHKITYEDAWQISYKMVIFSCLSIQQSRFTGFYYLIIA